MVTFWRHWIFATIVGVGAFVGMLVPPLVADENVGIGTTRPDSSAVLDVSIEALSRPRGMLIPRMTEQERDAIIFPARGLLIFNTTRNRIEMNIGDRTTPVWAHFVTYGESSGGDWALTGNAGIDPSRNFLGTVDAAPLIFKTDARERMRITPIGAVGIGTVTPLGLFAVGPNSEFYVDSSGTIYGVQLRLQGSNARLYIDGSSGIAGDILVSSGPNAPQRWTKQLDSLEITSLRSSTVSSRSVVTDTLRAQYIVGGIPFDSVKSGINQNQTLTVGNGSTVEASGTGIVRANRVNLTGTNAPLETNGNAGTSGQLLKSRGAGQTPEWTWSVDSLDIRRLTTKHVWADTVTADSVRGRVGRFDSVMVGSLRAAIPFDSVKSGINQNQTLTVGNGSTVEASGTGIVRANRVNLTGTNAPLETNGNAGTSGQLLKSRGAGQTPEWTWRLDSVDVGRLTVDHIWSDTLTADSVRGRVGRFDSLIVDFLRGDTAYISSLRIDTLYSSGGVLRAAIPFDSVKSGINQNQTLTVGNGSTVEASGTGIVRANRVNLTGTNAPLETNGNAGTSGQLLKSRGAGQTPEWTWRLDSLDVSRLTTNHVWADTVTADSVRGRVGRFDSLIVDFLRGDTAYVSSLRVDSIFSTGVLRAAVPFDSVKSGINQNQTLTVGNGSVLEASGSGIVRANRVNLTGTNAPLETNGNAGTSGQLLKSRGAGQTPEWTWRLDSVDVGRLTVDHIWSDTLTADSVRARVGRFDSVVVGSLRAAIPFDSVKSGVNQNQTLTVGNGSVLEASGSGIVRANRVNLTGTNAPLETNGNAGTSGQLLKSRGAGQTPEWTWRLDSVDVGRLTVDHIWSDTLTADSVRARVGRFDSVVVGSLRAAIPFDSVKSGVNQNQTLTVGNGSVLEASGSGIVRANRVNLTGTNAPLETNGNAGTSGQLLKSKGAGQTPEWTWRLDSVDVGRLTVDHIWSDTLTADSVRGRVGRFDSLIVDFLRGDTAYISSLRIDTLYSTGVLRAAVPFDSVKSGVNQNQTLTVGNGSVLEASGSGIVRANRVNLTGTNAPLETNGNAGTSGQLLKSKGAGQTPEWTWRLDSVDVGRLTVEHVWSDTLTADSVRARVGRFDSVVVGSLRAAIPFDSVKSGVNQNQTLTVGNGSVLSATGTGIVQANRVNLTGTNAPLETNGNAGTSGQLLKSRGAGQTPEWTWRLDSVDVGRLTVDHIWSDTLTADSVRARVGRFDSVVVGSLRAAIPFDSVKSGVNQNQTLTVGNGSVLEASGSGIVRANRVNLTGTNAPLETNGNAGTSGQLLKSKGAGQTPEWTWRLDSVDVGRLTVDHIWSDTLTADSVRGRVGRFDSLIVDFLRGDTAYISSLRIDTLYSTGVLRAAVPFDSVKSGVNQNQTLTVGNGSVLEASGSGIVRANRVNLTGSNAPLETNGNAGTSGQLLKSRGAGQTPEWTWRLDSVDVGRLTVDHIWSDTLTADSVRARVGRFDSVVVGSLRAAIPFDSVKSGVNQNQTLTVGNGSVLEASGSGIVRANRVNLTGTNAPLETNGNAGTSGQLLKSKGAGQTPEWTWRLDSVDVGRLTVDHIWSDTLTADSVRGRVGRFDSLIVDFLRGDTAYISSLRIDTLYSTGVLRAAVPFDSVKSGVNQNQTLTVGNGSVLEASGSGIVRANRVNLTGTNAPLETNGNAGTSGQLLKSKGAGQTPEWTWRLDSVDVGRLTVEHVWSDTLTADSVRARVGRFDSVVVGSLRAAIPFDSVKSGVNQNQTLTVGNGSVLEASGSGIVRANRVNLTGTNAPLETNGNAGTSGQLLKSRGAGQTPEWTWRLDSVDVGRLTVDHIWSDTLTADSVRARVGRFDSVVVGSLRAAIPFDSVKSGVNQNQTLTVGNGSVLEASGSGIVRANRVNLTGTNAPLETNGNAGTSGQLLKSKGAGQTPEWTWRLDSVDVGRLTVDHIWSDTLTADSVRGRVGRFDSLIVDFLRGDTAYISSLRIDTLYSTGVLRAAVPFDSVKSGVNQNQTLTVGNGSVLEASGSGIVRANRVNLTGSNAPLETNGNAGTSGQLLKSRGAGQTPEWTWRLDSVDVGRLTVDHIWSDTLTADSVRARVGRFDSVVVGSLRAAIPFDSVKSGVNQNQTLTVGNGSVLEASGSGIVRANRVNLTGTNAPLETNGNAGTSGQLLKSKGAGQTPEWTWRLDSVDVGRLTVDHIWSDTLTADSVRGRVGRFDSLIVDFLRGDTAYISSLRIDSLYSSGGVLRAAIPFDSVKSGVNQNQTLTVGNGSVLSATGTGIVQANRVNLTGTNAPLETNGNAGTSGQLLKSRGAGQTPEWTWRLDSVDVGRLTVDHIWSDTLTADSVRARVGRFDSVVVGSLRAAIPFDSVKSGVNQNQTLTVGNGSVLSATGTGIVQANRVNLTGTNAPLETNGNAGTSGQLLKSRGAGQTPEWTWRLDSVDVGRLTVDHIWSDTLTADSVRARVGRFDSVVVGSLRAAIPFDSVKSGVNQNQTLTVGNGSTVEASGTGIVRANRVNLTGSNAPLETNGNAGTSGQLLKSRGAGQTPEWTWRLDSVDVGRLTVDHIWSDTLTADSVRGRVGRFDSLIVDFLRGDTAYISSLRIDTLYSSGGVLRAAIPFDSVKSGVNQNQTLTVGNGSTVEASGTGIVRANRVNLTGTNAPLETNGNAGSSGQLLKSRGAGQTPEWTWRLDSLDVGRLTVEHVWSDTLTADSVRARVGRFDSVVVGSLRAAIPFDSVKSGINQNQTLTVGNGSTVEASGTGIVRANRVNLTGTNAPLETNGNAGTSGQLLKSKGAGQTPEWTWRLDSVDVGRLTVEHVWSDTLTADSVRARVGRFDSVVVDFVRGDTAYISSLRIDSLYSSGGVLRAAIPFDSVKSGVNQNQTLTVGNGSVLEASGSGIVRANRVNLTGTNAPLETNGNAGTSGQLLKSKGAGQTPEWTWRLDSVDVGRLTVDHIWSDTLTADSVRARVGRFDSVVVDFVRGDTAYISSLRVDTLFSTGVLRAAVPFDSVKSGINQNQTLTVGNGSTVEASGTGIVRANRVNLTGTNAPLETNGNAGTSGQLLKSKGAGQTPEWTWRLDSLDVGRLTVDHIWSDTLTADSVRARVGRFDSVVVDFVRGDTAYISSLRIDSLYSSGGVLRAAIPFDSVKSGINQNQTLTVGNGSTVEASGTGIVRANRVNLTGTNAPLETNGSAGTSGQLLKSKGAGQTPEWTWSVDSLDIRRLTTKHVWSDTVTADSVRGRVGRFDSLVVATPFAWQLKGNSGTNPATNFLGTTDAQPLVLRTNGSERLRVESGGNVGIGTPSPTHRLHVNAPSDPLRLEGVQTDASPAEVLTVTATGVVKKASVASIVGGGILKGIFTPTTTASQFTISPGQDIQPGAVVVVTVYGSSSSGVVGAMVTNINAATDTFTIATTMAIDNTYAIHYIIINP